MSNPFEDKVYFTGNTSLKGDVDGHVSNESSVPDTQSIHSGMNLKNMNNNRTNNQIGSGSAYQKIGNQRIVLPHGESDVDLDDDFDADLELMDHFKMVRRRRNIIALAVVLFTSLVIMIAVSVVKNEKKRTPKTIVATEELLFEKCNTTSLASKEGFHECKEACHSVECCAVPADMPGTCHNTKRDICKEYFRSCRLFYDNWGDESDDKGKEILEEDDDFSGYDKSNAVEVPPAPSKLLDICSNSAISSIAGFQKCNEICMQAECCSANEYSENCLSANPNTCPTYAPCSILGTLFTNDGDSSPDSVDEQCSRENMAQPKGIQQCHQACAPAMCCFAGKDGLGGHKCDPNSLYCKKYSICEQLKYKTDDPSACLADEIQMVVSKDNCSNECADKMCCFEKDLSKNCYTKQPMVCGQYAACAAFSE